MHRAARRLKIWGTGSILGVAAILTWGVRTSEQRALGTALADHQLRAQAGVQDVAVRVEDTLRSTYEGLRTIARLPGVRGIDRYATTFDANARSTVQELYNNLAANVAVSEVYIVPVDLDPDALDPVTGRAQEPITTFDEFIVNRNADSGMHGPGGGVEVDEIEIFEYRQMKRQLAWFAQHCPTESAIDGLAYPVLTSPEVLTCDNTRYSPSRPDDKDRSGLVFSVPFFGSDGKLRGCVSAVILTRALEDLLPSGEYALRASAIEFTALGHPAGPAHSHAAAIARGEAAGDLQCSFTTDLRFADAGTRWVLWRGVPNTAFEALPDTVAAKRVSTVSYAGIAGLTGTGIVLAWMIARTMALARFQRDQLEHEVARQTQALRALALTDKLTGLPNRAMITDSVERAVALANRAGTAGYGVLFLDFDRFKLVNDTMGHEAGDELLRSIAARLRGSLRDTDSVGQGSTPARLGGDEFVVLLEGLARPEDADIVAHRLVQVLAQPHHIAGQQVVSSASIGVVRGDLRYERGADVLRDADTAMYEAKAAGKGRYVVFDAAMRERILRRAGLDRDVREAAPRGELYLHYQPVVRLDDGVLESVEALVRWRHADLGFVSPAEFIPIAEESGAINTVTDWVMREACRQVAEWHRALGPERTPRIAINLSRAQLGAPDLDEHLSAMAREAGIEPANLCLEITETAVTKDQKTATAALARLKKAGFRISLDDFGTGYSSLSTLRQFPLDAVKLDRSFIAESSMGREHAALVSAVVSLAANLGLAVVAEGVETPEQAAALQAMDCRYAQGYLFGRAVPPARIVDMINDKRRTAA